MKTLTEESIQKFKENLLLEERAEATVKKYVRDLNALRLWLGDKELDKMSLLNYKTHISKKYLTASVNSILSSINSFLVFCGLFDLRIKTVKVQRQIFECENKELKKKDYEKLLMAAKKKNERTYLLLQTVCSTGIRISELRFITVESLVKNVAEINCKGKLRRVFLPTVLSRALCEYAKANGIKSGSVFVSKNGNPLDRSNIWSDMKSLCKEAGVDRDKVFPHNLRHLFARTYYSMQKDLVRLADILGHSSVNTTRIYTKESGEVHRRQIQHLGLLGV